VVFDVACRMGGGPNGFFFCANAAGGAGGGAGLAFFLALEVIIDPNMPFAEDVSTSPNFCHCGHTKVKTKA
jgi:hypothetical protein